MLNLLKILMAVATVALIVVPAVDPNLKVKGYSVDPVAAMQATVDTGVKIADAKGLSTQTQSAASAAPLTAGAAPIFLPD